MDDFDARQLTIGLEGQLQVAVNEQLMKALNVTGISYIVHLKLDGSAAAARRGSINITEHPAGTQDDLGRALELHNGRLPALTPEYLRRHTYFRLRVTSQNKGLVGFVETVELRGTRAMRSHQSIVDRVGSRVLHKTRPIAKKSCEPKGNRRIPVGFAGAD